jgi:purine-binding chemotaxis protein CheW
VIIEVDDGGESHDIGIMVDAVSAVIEIAAQQIEPAPSFGSSVRTEFVAGLGKVDENFVIILDIARTFSMDELAVLDNAA